MIRRIKAAGLALKNTEVAVFFWIHLRLARQWLDWAMKTLTNLGGTYAAAGACISTWTWPGLPRAYPLSMTTAVVASQLAVQVLKRLVQRRRPYFIHTHARRIVAPLRDHSFPSGHTACAFAMAGVISAFAPQVAALVWSAASLVGISRLYLGHHYPLDVIAGIITGWASAGISLAMFGP